jgi:hypothetical protein
MVKEDRGFQRLCGQGIANVEWKLVDGMKHAVVAVLWPHVREILERVVPLTDPKTSHKL